MTSSTSSIPCKRTSEHEIPESALQSLFSAAELKQLSLESRSVIIKAGLPLVRASEQQQRDTVNAVRAVNPQYLPELEAHIAHYGCLRVRPVWGIAEYELWVNRIVAKWLTVCEHGDIVQGQ